MLLDIGKEVEVCKEDKEGDCICTHCLSMKSKEIKNIMKTKRWQRFAAPEEQSWGNRSQRRGEVVRGRIRRQTGSSEVLSGTWAKESFFHSYRS